MAQKTLLQLSQSIASELNLPTPSVVISSQDQNVLQILALIRASQDDLLRDYDWQMLQSIYNFNTVVNTASYALPADFQRFINLTFYDQTNHWPARGPTTPSQWELLKSGIFNGGPFERFRVFGNQFYLTPTPQAIYTFEYEYISNYVVLDASTGLPKADYTADADICVFDHRLMIYFTKLKFREAKGLDTTKALADFEACLTNLQGSDTPGPVLTLDRRGVGVRTITTSNIPDANWAS